MSSIGWQGIKFGEFLTLLMENRQNLVTRDRIINVLEHYGENLGSWYVVLDVDQWQDLNPWINLFPEIDEMMEFEPGTSWALWHDTVKHLKIKRQNGSGRLEKKP